MEATKVSFIRKQQKIIDSIKNGVVENPSN